jgi:hypothetical protein
MLYERSVTVRFRTSPEMQLALEAAAKREERTVSALCRFLISNALMSNGKQHEMAEA